LHAVPGQELQIRGGPAAGQIVLVTGGTGGIRKATALGLAAMGALLAITNLTRAFGAGPGLISAVLPYRLPVLPGWLCWRSLPHQGYA
jgi:hypothetical protein